MSSNPRADAKGLRMIQDDVEPRARMSHEKLTQLLLPIKFTERLLAARLLEQESHSGCIVCNLESKREREEKGRGVVIVGPITPPCSVNHRANCAGGYG